MRIVLTRLVLASLCFLPAPALTAEPSPEPPPDADVRRETHAGQITLTGGPRGLLVTFPHANYQASATLTFRAASPHRVTFRFPSMRTLHSFTLTNGKQTFSVQPSAAGKTRAYFDKSGQSIGNAALAQVIVEVEFHKTGGVDVVATSRGVPFARELRASWVQYLLRNGYENF